jgi:hypothetical protein
MNPLQHLISGAPVLAVPSWADGMAMLERFDYLFTDIPVPPGGSILAAPAEPDRWAIGFTGPTGTDTRVAPFGDPAALGFRMLDSVPGTMAWFTVFTHGPLVPREWYAGGTGGITIRVHRISLRG